MSDPREAFSTWSDNLPPDPLLEAASESLCCIAEMAGSLSLALLMKNWTTAQAFVDAQLLRAQKSVDAPALASQQRRFFSIAIEHALVAHLLRAEPSLPAHGGSASRRAFALDIALACLVPSCLVRVLRCLSQEGSPRLSQLPAELSLWLAHTSEGSTADPTRASSSWGNRVDAVQENMMDSVARWLCLGIQGKGKMAVRPHAAAADAEQRVLHIARSFVAELVSSPSTNFLNFTLVARRSLVDVLLQRVRLTTSGTEPDAARNDLLAMCVSLQLVCLRNVGILSFLRCEPSFASPADAPVPPSVLAETAEAGIAEFRWKDLLQHTVDDLKDCASLVSCTAIAVLCRAASMAAEGAGSGSGRRASTVEQARSLLAGPAARRVHRANVVLRHALDHFKLSWDSLLIRFLEPRIAADHRS